jgi:ERCC4-type nuclease
MRYKRKPKLKTNIVVVYDDREKHPWQFLSKRWPMKKKRLKVGDYSVSGYEDKIAIEKKSGFNELFSNLTGKERARFERFLLRLSAYPLKCIVVEQPFTNSILTRISAILQKRTPTRLTPRTIHYWTSKIVALGIPILYVDKASREQIVCLLIEQFLTKLEG